jgi:GDPmannose 4,6-dehydratase
LAKRAFITGIAGQDGSYLAEYLLSMDYEVFGLIRRNSITEHQQNRLEHIAKHVHTEYGDVLDLSSIQRVMALAKPDEVYNLAAQSHVRISFDLPQLTGQTNALGALNVLEHTRTAFPDARFYQASSSEMFGNSVDPDGMQRESTKMTPVSPYGCAKLYAFNIVRNYRNAYGVFAANGILFNHESPRRASNFVTNKIVKNAVLISRGAITKLELGNMDSCRDWGHAKDYVRAMHAILQHSEPDDFVVSTGETHSIRELCDLVFRKLGMDYREHVVQNPKYMRPEELRYLCGDCTKVKDMLGWKAEYSFDKLVDEMIEAGLRNYV